MAQRHAEADALAAGLERARAVTRTEENDGNLAAGGVPGEVAVEDEPYGQVDEARYEADLQARSQDNGGVSCEGGQLPDNEMDDLYDGEWDYPIDEEMEDPYGGVVDPLRNEEMDDMPVRAHGRDVDGCPPSRRLSSSPSPSPRPPSPRPPSPTYSIYSDDDFLANFQHLALLDETEGEEPPPNEEEVPVDITQDPLHASREELMEMLDEEDQHPELELPPAFNEDRAIRHAYVRAFVLAAFKGGTHAAVQNELAGFKTLLQGLQARTPGLSIEGLSTMAQTIATAERRLGLSTEGFIAYYALCDKCWAAHDIKTLDRRPSPNCSVHDCSGKVYIEKQLSGGKARRVPVKILSYVSPHRALQHLLLRPGKFEDFQRWRKTEDDQPLVGIPPLAKPAYDTLEDQQRPMKDVYDGWRWRAAEAGLKRRRGGEWGMEDVRVSEVEQRLVALPGGLQIQLNLDW
jgi:hypothetical protein